MKALFVTNAGPVTGGGHLSRCLALSQALDGRGAESVWALNGDAAPQAAALGINNAFFFPDPFNDDISSLLGNADFSVIDSYEADEGFYESASSRSPLVVIDAPSPIGAERFARVIIDYAIGAETCRPSTASCEYLSGPRYAPLRREYWNMEPRPGNYALFVPGAADVAGSAADIAGMWPEDACKLVIVLGPLVPVRRGDEARAAARGRGNVEIAASPQDFPSLLAGAGRVICSASVTAYEALAMEKPTAVFTVADNQRGLGEYLSGIGAAFDLGEWRDAGPDSIRDALRFAPNREALKGLVNKRGALACAEAIMDIMGH